MRRQLNISTNNLAMDRMMEIALSVSFLIAGVVIGNLLKTATIKTAGENTELPLTLRDAAELVYVANGIVAIPAYRLCEVADRIEFLKAEIDKLRAEVTRH